jgi:pimeloyl-ACP methyl ester carboxylesterase
MLDKLKSIQYALKVKWYEATQDRLRVIDLDGRKVQLMEGGEGEPLLYLHSAYGENLWMPFHQKLSEAYRVIAPAHPGFAQTEGGEDIDSMEDMIFHYLDLLDYLGLTQIDIAGVSLGGWIAAEFATRYPDRVRRLALAAPVGLWMDEHPVTDLFALLLNTEKLRVTNFHDAESSLARMLVPDEADDDMKAEAYKGMAATARLAWNPFCHNPKLARRLRRIKSPTLIIWGDDDKLVPTAYAQEWARHIKDSRVAKISECGHLMMFEKEEEFVRALKDFFG